MKEPKHLPYTDTKAVGAADFYFAINATFRFILNRFGKKGLERYWTELGEKYYAPVAVAWKHSGFEGVGNYWKDFFAAEPGSAVDVEVTEEAVILDVQVCPAIAHLRQHGREIVPSFCQHCFFVSEAMSRSSGLTVRIDGGNGTCRQVFSRPESAGPPQDFSRIKEAT
jgi:hypothetical protein